VPTAKKVYTSARFIETFLASLSVSVFSTQQVNYKSHVDILYNSFTNCSIIKVNLILFIFSVLKSTSRVRMISTVSNTFDPPHKEKFGSGALKEVPAVFSDPTEKSFPFS